MYTTTCETDSHWEAAVSHREPRLVRCDDLEGWDGDWVGRRLQRGDGVGGYMHL